MFSTLLQGCNNLKIIKVISGSYKASTFKKPYQGIAICQSYSLMILTDLLIKVHHIMEALVDFL